MDKFCMVYRHYHTASFASALFISAFFTKTVAFYAFHLHGIDKKRIYLV